MKSAGIYFIIPILGLIFKLEVARQSSQSRPFWGFLNIGTPPFVTQEIAYRAEPVEPSSGKHSALNNETVGAGSILLPNDEKLQPEGRPRRGVPIAVCIFVLSMREPEFERHLGRL